MRKDFKNLDIYAAFKPANGAEWQKANGIHADWKTPEHIEVKPVYTKKTWKVWNIWAMLPVCLLICAVRTQ